MENHQDPAQSTDSETPHPSDIDEAPKHPKRRTLWPVALGGTAVLAVILGVGFIPNSFEQNPNFFEDVGIAEAIVDSDSDGLPDRIEVRGWKASDGDVYVTDPHSADTDLDGLTDGIEAGQFASKPHETMVFACVSDPTETDSDDDGLDDRLEVEGWDTKKNETYLTDPKNPDSDDDGLFDSDEAGTIIEQTGSVTLFSGLSDPTMPDTDGDGLPDLDEADYSLNAFSADTDKDGLNDLYEVNVAGTDPNSPDTDGDGYDDKYEDTNRESQGLDPLFEDVEISTADYATDFAKGALAGDFMYEDSTAWLAGNLAVGGASLIPGFGWVLGGAADLRDVIASAIQSDWLGVGFSAVGLIPSVGDAAAIPAKVTGFVERYPKLAAPVGSLIVKLNKVPDSVRIESSKHLWKQWDDLLDAGADEKALLLLQTSGRLNIDRVYGDTLKRNGHRMGSPSPFLADGQDGKTVLEKTLRKSNPNVQTKVRASTKNCTDGCNPTARVLDVVDDGVAHESKVGFKSLDASTRQQINSDAYLIETGVIDGAHWHFYPSEHTHEGGATEPLLDLLDEKGIAYTIHLPTTE